MKNRRKRPRGTFDNSDENLRGKFRDLQKQLNTERRYIKSLEKKLRGTAGFSEKRESGKSIVSEPTMCSNCGEENCTKKITISAPHTTYVWIECELCQFRERKK